MKNQALCAFERQGCTTTEIAKNLDITERAVNFHIQNINRKLGTKNKYQSIAKAKEMLSRYVKIASLSPAITAALLG